MELIKPPQDVFTIENPSPVGVDIRNGD